MITHRILNTLLAIFVIGAWLYLAANFDAETEQGDTRHQAGLAEDMRFARAAQAVCGPNAAWSETTHKNQIMCETKRGHKTITAQVQP
ncbi:MAG: hypothetical protein M0P52_00050 [Rhodoferax sp.]|nr:hypothetical protein [Rhodoferax sp.]